MLGKEVLAILVRLSKFMVAKMEELILNVQGWINGHIANMVVVQY